MRILHTDTGAGLKKRDDTHRHFDRDWDHMDLNNKINISNINNNTFLLTKTCVAILTKSEAMRTRTDWNGTQRYCTEM